MNTIAGIVFDKDGTLFDFQKTWGCWAVSMLEHLADGQVGLAAQLADAIHFDPVTQTFAPESLVIAGTTEEVADVLRPLLPDYAGRDLAHDLNLLSRDTPQVPAVDLRACLMALRQRGLRIGLATNDSELGAHAHLESAGVEDLFDFVAGYDSGFGAKPAPGQLLGFAAAANLAPGQIAMVGDSTHDLIAAHAAGMRAVGVLTGPATHDVLAPVADVVLPDIGAIGTWLDQQG